MTKRAAAFIFSIAVAMTPAAGVSTDGGLSAERRSASASQGASPRIVWVALEGAGKIAKVDVASGEVLRRPSAPGAPHNLTIAPSGRTIATSLWRSGSIMVRHRGRQRRVGLDGAPHDVKIGGGRVIVANQSRARLDLVAPRGKFRRSIALKADPHDLALRWAGRQAWVTLEGSDDLAVVRLRRPSRVRYVSTGRAPHDILFAPDGKLWVSDWDGAIHVFSRRGRHIKTIPMGIEAHHLDFTPDGNQAWITDHAAQKIFVVNTGRYKIRKQFDVAGAPHHVAITSDGDRAAVADHERGLIVVYNVNKLHRGKTIKVGAGPHGIWAVP